MTNKCYILGGGISSLIYNFYHPEFTIISPEIGGKLSNSFMKHIVYLHADEYSENFLKDLGVEIKKKTQIIKYVKAGECRNEITVLDKIRLIKKKMNDDKFEVIDTKLSTEDYYISVFCVDFEDIINKLKPKCNIIEDKIIRITDTEIITEKTRYEYANIISTLPANIFWDLFYQKHDIELKTQPITFALADAQPTVLEHSNYNLCYFIDSKPVFSRVSKRDNLFLYEFSGELTKEEVQKHLQKHTIIRQYYVEKDGIICSNVNNIPPKNIQFLGRFARHEHSYKINNVIEFSQFNYDFRNIWNSQLSFSKNFIDINRLDDQKYVEEMTHKFLLHLFAEVAEVLETTNYKMHKIDKVLNVNKIKEELIDCQKYLLNLFLLYQVDVQEFIQLFHDKSKIVEERFKQQNDK